jgi:aquaporin Z
LVSVILGTASKAQNIGSFSAIAVGGYIALSGIWAGPVSGASMNPATAFCEAIITFNFSVYWLFVLAPLFGSMISVVFAYLLRGPGGDKVAKKLLRR